MIAPIDVTNIRLETPRLIIRAWEESDLEDFYEYARVDGVGQRAGWKPHESIEVSKEILAGFIAGKKTFALQLKDSGKVIGSLGLEAREDGISIPEGMQGREVGYVLSKNYWGKGLMPEAVSAVAKYCFDALSYDYITCGHFLSNQQSRRVIEKCGFTYVDTIDYTTRMGTHEQTMMYILYNPTRKR